MAEGTLQLDCPPEPKRVFLSVSANGDEEERAASPPRVDMAEDPAPSAAERIGVIEERAFRRECVVRMLRELLPEYSVGAIERPRDAPGSACASVDQTGPPADQEVDVVVLDIGWTRLPNEEVSADLRFLQERLAEVAIVLLSDREDSAHVEAALRYGVRGLIPSTLCAAVVAEAVRLVCAGGTFIPASALIWRQGDQQDEAGQGQGSGEKRVNLTPREFEVLNLLREGKPNKMIAATLNLHETTVKIHVRHIMKKLNAANRTQAALMAERLL